MVNEEKIKKLKEIIKENGACELRELQGILALSFGAVKNCVSEAELFADYPRMYGLSPLGPDIGRRMLVFKSKEGIERYYRNNNIPFNRV